MKAGAILIGVTGMMLVFAVGALAQADREDIIWARVAPSITLDGVLNEPAWAQAESVVIRFGVDNGIPGSGWKYEGGNIPNDPTLATLKLLTVADSLYLGAVVRDASIGGSKDFNRFDGFLMALKDHLAPDSPKPPAEYFYAWWYAEGTDPQPPGQSPAFIGRWAEWPPGTPRTPEQIQNWNAVTRVRGLSNSDAVRDTSYTVEMKFALAPMGYDVTRPAGDIVEWNISIYDCDWFWPINAQTFASNRVWWQSPWGNTAWYSEVRVYSRPDVTVSSGPVPEIGPELILEEVAGTVPTIDGSLTEPIWNDPDVYSFRIKWGDDALRQTYPAVGPYRSGQFQPEVNGGQAFVADPGEATVKIFYQNDTMYFGFDVNDRVVQYHPLIDRWDGFIVTLNERFTRGPDQNLLAQRLSFQVGETGEAIAQDYLGTLVAGGKAQVAIDLKPGTTVDTLGTTPDVGYWAEMSVDMTGLSYPAGLYDATAWLGVNLLDGDSFIPITDSYGTRTWWFREYEGQCCPVWVFLNPIITGVDDPGASPPAETMLVRSYPNPSPDLRIEYNLARESQVTLEVFDVQGRLVERRELGRQAPGRGETTFNGSGKTSGLYLYRLLVHDVGTGGLTSTLHGRMVVLN